jgi:hypothetical protein
MEKLSALLLPASRRKPGIFNPSKIPLDVYVSPLFFTLRRTIWQSASAYVYGVIVGHTRWRPIIGSTELPVSTRCWQSLMTAKERANLLMQDIHP